MEEKQKKLKEFTKNTDELQIIQSTPITITKNMIDKKFKQILERDKDLKKIRIHDLRHSHASYLISKHISIVAVSKKAWA